MRERSGVPAAAPEIDVHLTSAGRREALAVDVLRGLTSEPKELPAKWFYDERGSELFDEITRLPEYYLTRREREILIQRVDTIAALTRAETLVELGSGSSGKTRLLIDALLRGGSLRRFVPFDVSEEFLRESAGKLASDYPGLAVHGVVGDFEHHLGKLPDAPRRLVAFLGSSLGNLVGANRARFLRAIREYLGPGEALLLGADLVKDVARLEAAYNDADGVTIAFNRNVLSVIDDELGADFDLERFEHVARFDPVEEWIDIGLRSLENQSVRIAAIDLEVEFSEGELMRTEISDKFRRPGLEAELVAAGFEPARWWEDAHGDFALTLAFAR